VAERIANNTYTTASDLDIAELEWALGGRLQERQGARGWLHRIAPGEFPREELSVRAPPIGPAALVSN